MSGSADHAGLVGTIGRFGAGQQIWTGQDQGGFLAGSVPAVKWWTPHGRAVLTCRGERRLDLIGLEFEELTWRTTIAIGFVALGLIGGAGLYASTIATPACRNAQVVGRLHEILRDEFHLNSILLNNITTASGGFFSRDHECSAEVTEIRGNVDASAMPWREIRYHIVHQESSQPPAITVELGGNVPLAPPAPSFWEWLLAYL